MDRGNIIRALAAEVRTRRQHSGRTAEEMQHVLGWSRNTYKRTEQAKRRLFADEIFEVATALRIDPDELVAGAYQRVISANRPPPGVADEWLGALGLD